MLAAPIHHDAIHQLVKKAPTVFGSTNVCFFVIGKFTPRLALFRMGNKPLFQTIIGMEIHAQLDIPTKLFSSAPKVDTLSTPPNSTAVWPLDVAVPGVLPRTSLEAVQAALLTAAACNCQIPNSSRFERKHYAYADLPLGYQVTQQRWPIATNGVLKCRRRTMDPSGNRRNNKSRF